MKYIIFCLCLIHRFFSVNAIQAEWKNLRDYFRNELKKIPIPNSGNAGDIAAKSHWPYFKNSMFLEDQFLPRQSQSNLPNSEDDLEETDDVNLEEKEPFTQLSNGDDTTQTESVDQSLPPTPSSCSDEPRTIIVGRSR